MKFNEKLFLTVCILVIYHSLKFEELNARGIFIKIMTLDIGTQMDAEDRTLNVN